MNRFIRCLIFLALILTACKQHKENIIFHNKPSDEAEITTLIFNATVSSDAIFKKRLLEENSMVLKMMHGLKLREKDIQQQKRKLDTLKKELDTAKVYVLIADTLVRMHKDYLKGKFSHSNSRNTLPEFTFLNSWASEININENFGKFNPDNLSHKYKYVYVLADEFKQQGGTVFIAGRFSMSSIFYNSKKNKAFVYTQFVCGGTCGDGEDLYLEKKNGKWSIIARKNDWVS